MNKKYYLLVLVFLFYFVCCNGFAEDRSEYIMENIEYFHEHREELKTNVYGDLVMLAQFYSSDGVLKDQSGEPGSEEDFNKAHTYYQKAIELEPTETMPYRGLALIQYHYMNQKEEGFKNAKIAIDKGWDYFDLALIMGDVLKQEGKTEEANVWFKKAYESMKEYAPYSPEIKEFPEYKEFQKKFDS